MVVGNVLVQNCVKYSYPKQLKGNTQIWVVQSAWVDFRGRGKLSDNLIGMDCVRHYVLMQLEQPSSAFSDQPYAKGTLMHLHLHINTIKAWCLSSPVSALLRGPGSMHPLYTSYIKLHACNAHISLSMPRCCWPEVRLRYIQSGVEGEAFTPILHSVMKAKTCKGFRLRLVTALCNVGDEQVIKQRH